MKLGTRFGDYELDDEVGRGGMGVVYRATHVATGRAVALKVMLEEVSHGTFRARFIRESRITRSIDHPHVVPVLDAGEHEGRLFIAMGFVEGPDLGEILDASPHGLEVDRAVRLISQAAAGLDEAHGRGLVHRDVKPGNILVAGRGADHVYLSDFGLTRLTDGATRLTKTGQFVGTVAYCAPEQITGERVGPAADVYALGCVLFHTLAGRLPFESDSEIALMYAHVNDPAPDLASIAPLASPSLATVVARALAKAPRERYASAGELAFAAAAAAEDSPADGLATLRHRLANLSGGDGPPVDVAELPAPAPPVASPPAPPPAPPPADDAVETPPGRATPGRVGTALARAILATAIVLALVVLAGFGAFAVAESQRPPGAQTSVLLSYQRTVPGPMGERRREAVHGPLRERIDDANDVLLQPFAGILKHGNRWLQRGLPSGLALLFYSLSALLLAALARRLPW
jgi:serine/threonine protein kinase